MLRLLITAVLLFSSTAQAAKTTKECEALIKKEYPGVFSIVLRIIGEGKYATHFNYEIRYVKDLKNPYTNLGCTARVYCADYDNLVHVELKHCGR